MLLKPLFSDNAASASSCLSMSQDSLNFTEKGIKPLTKWVLCSLLSLALLVADERLAVVAQARNYVMAAVYPVRQLLALPVSGFEYGSHFLTRQADLVAQNEQLRRENAVLAAQAAQTASLRQEFVQLHQLFDLSENLAETVAVAQVVRDSRHPLQERLVIDKGSRHGVRPGQAATDAYGLIGQITSVSPFSAEITPLKNRASVIPVMVARTGFRTLLYGDTQGLDLRYFPSAADLQVNDVLVTSGIDANYTAGIPVARVVSLEKAGGTPYYRVRTEAAGNAESARYIMIFPLNRIQETPPQPPAAEDAVSFRQPEVFTESAA